MSARRLTSTDRTPYLDERQRLLPAADQRRFLLLLLLHNGSKGHQGGEGRAAHCSQHPGPDGREREREWASVPAAADKSLVQPPLLCVNGCLFTRQHAHEHAGTHTRPQPVDPSSRHRATLALKRRLHRRQKSNSTTVSFSSSMHAVALVGSKQLYQNEK